MVHPGYRKRTIFLLVALLVVRFWFGQTFELSGQEAYLWLQGHGTNISPAYWERGPLVPLLIRIGTAFFGDTELGVRWPAAVICCTTGFILFYLARHWFNARAAFWTVVLFVVVPMYAWKLSFMTEATASIGLMALAMFAFSLAIEKDRGWWWLLGGAACGLALLAALANGWWIVGLVIYFAGNRARRERVRQGWLWGSIAFSGLFLAPLIWWWRGPQVADVAHSRLLSIWPLTHGFSLNQGFHFIGLEIFYLCPLFFIVLVVVLERLGRQLWDDPRYSLLACLAVPGLIWQNFAAFFHEGRFDLVPALYLPLVLLAGCFVTRLTVTDRRVQWVAAAVLILAAMQSLAGLNPFYFAPRLDGHGYQVRRTQSGENVTGFHAERRQISWRNLADAVQGLQRDQGVGATLIIADSPETASALSFYLPHNPFVYVASKPQVITHFDFWPGYAQSASPNDSALFIGHSTSADHPADPPPPDIFKNFATVTPMEDAPLPDFDKTWDLWNCQNFIGSGAQAPGDVQTNPMRDSDALPK
jgi:4-amino-4-deoxy-L-arabinose transferase-like glycosyltransferase